MSKIINDNMLKENRKWIPPMILFIVLLVLFPFSLFYGEMSIKEFIAVELSFVIASLYFLYGFLYTLKYKVFITEETVFLVTLFNKIQINFEDIETYTVKRYKKTYFYQFEIFSNNKKVILNTRFKEEVEEIFKDKVTAKTKNK